MPIGKFSLRKRINSQQSDDSSDGSSKMTSKMTNARTLTSQAGVRKPPKNLDVISHKNVKMVSPQSSKAEIKQFTPRAETSHRSRNKGKKLLSSSNITEETMKSVKKN